MYVRVHSKEEKSFLVISFIHHIEERPLQFPVFPYLENLLLWYVYKHLDKKNTNNPSIDICTRSEQCIRAFRSAFFSSPYIEYCIKHEMSRVVRNQRSAYAKTKTQISFAVTAKLISAFVFATRIVQSLFFLNPKFQASSHLL